MSDEFRQRIIDVVAKRTGADPDSIDERTPSNQSVSALDVLASEPWVRDEWTSELYEAWPSPDVAAAVQATLARDA
jgi:hypothetical protein